MMWQLLIVGAIITWAIVVTTIRLFTFFKAPGSKCHGCSGCSLKELNHETGVKRRS